MKTIKSNLLFSIIGLLLIVLCSFYYYKNVYNKKTTKDVRKLEQSENTSLLFDDLTPGQIEVMKKMQKLKPGEEATYQLRDKNAPRIKEYLKKYPQDSSRVEIIFGHRVK